MREKKQINNSIPGANNTEILGLVQSLRLVRFLLYSAMTELREGSYQLNWKQQP